MTPEQIEKALIEVSEACKDKSRGELIGLITHIDILRHEQGTLIDNLTRRLAATTAVADAAIEQLRSDGRHIPYELAESYMAVTANAQNEIAKQNRDHIQNSITVGVKEQRKAQARKGADAVHNKDGGSRDIKAKVIAMWAAGDKYTSRDACAADASYIFDKSFKSMRAHLNNTPDPSPWGAKERALAAKKQKK